MNTTSVGGWRGILGVLAIAVGVGLAYGSLTATVISQWIPTAGSGMGVVLLAASAAVVILVWLLGAVIR
jgi:hypothetical protein